MKKITLFIGVFVLWVIFLSALEIKAQTTVTIGTGVTDSYYAPVYISTTSSSYYYSNQISLFTAAEISNSGTIEAVAWNKSNTEGYTASDATFDIYMKTTTATSVPTAVGTFATELTGATLVYSSATQNINTTTGWQTFTLTTPFSYNGSDNLMILVDWHRPSTATGNYPSWYYTSAAGYAATWCGTTPNPTDNGYGGGYTRPNTQITFAPSVPNDAGVVSIDAPVSPTSLGSNNVEVTIRNSGINDLTSVDIDWEFNGVPQTTYNWTGTLTPGLTNGPILLGSANFVNGINTVKAWTTNPNLTTDGYNMNDTIEVDIMACNLLSGTYTIGGVTPDYATINDAISAMEICGVSGPVTFNIRSGTYNEQISIPEIMGASGTNLITFQSETGNNTDVIIDWPSSAASTDNFTIQFNGADHFIFQNLTIQRSGLNAYARVVVFENEASNNQLINNVIIGQEYSGTSANYTVIYSPSTQDTSLKFIGNEIIGGGYAVFIDATSAGPGTGIVFMDNYVHNWSSYGIRLEYALDPVIQGNNFVANSSYTTNYGIYMYYCDSNMVLDKNRIELWGTSSNYGIYISYCDAAFGNEGYTTNNFITQLSTTTGTTYGIYIYNSNYQNIYYNSILLTSGSLTTGRGLYANSSSSGTYGNINIQNNNVVNTGGGLAVEISSGAVTLNYVTKCDFNNFYSSGTAIGEYNNAAQSDLAAWQTASSFDANSVSVNPIFLAADDLHTLTIGLDGAGVPIAAVLDDFDGDVRDAATPDIGADEFIMASDDAGVYTYDSPLAPALPGANNIEVTIMNYGTLDLTSVDIDWEFNGVPQTTYNWTGVITPGTTNGPITIGSGNLITGVNNIKVWTTNPNMTTDGNNVNDTIEVDIMACAPLSGVYTLGTVSSDYLTFADAIDDLITCGVGGPVTFDIASGTYNEQIILTEVPNTSGVNTITFQSETGNNTDVIIDWPSSTSATNNFSVQFDGADHFIFQNVTIRRSGTESYARVVVFENEASSNQLINNVIIGQEYTGTSSDYAAIYSPSTQDTSLKFIGNEIIGGGYAVYLDATSAAPGTGIIFMDNYVHDWSYCGIRLEYANGAIVQGNEFVGHNTTSHTTNYGIYMYYCDSNIFVNRNKVELWSPSSNYGVYLYYCDAAFGNEGVVSNNFVSQLSTATSTNYGIYPYYSSYQNIYYNSIHLTSGGSSSNRGIYAYASTSTSYGNINIQNNNIVNTGGGYAIGIYSSAVTSGYVTKCDYNNYYVSGPALGDYGGTPQVDLAAWQTASSFDGNSISVNPNFMTASDLHIFSLTLDSTATPISTVTDDIDGDVRDLAFPDIGADEFTLAPVDAGVSAIGPVIGNIGGDDVEVTITNYGTLDLTSVDIDWELNGVPQTTFNWTGTILPGTSNGPVIIGTGNFISGMNTVKAWTTNPNMTVDGHAINDTLEVDIFGCNVLDGVYTIGPSGADYPTINDAINDMTSCGIGSPVTFNIQPGTYTEQVSIPEILGTSSTNTITFQSETGNSADVIIDWPSSASSTDNFTLQFNGAKYVIFQNLTIQRSGNDSYARVVVFENEAADDQLINNIIIGQNYSGTSANYTVIYSPTTKESNISVIGNEIIGGGYGIYFDGASSSPETGLLFLNNYVHDWSSYGIRVEYAFAPVVQGNDFVANAVSPYSTNYGIYMYYCDYDVLVDKNRVELWGTSSNYGLYISYCDGASGSEGLCSNNFVSQLSTSTSTTYGIYVYYSSYQNVYNNSINITSGSTTSGRGIYAYSSTSTSYGNINILNNNVVNTGGGYAIGIYSSAVTSGYVTSCDYNNFYVTGSSVGDHGGSAQADLAAWQIVSSFDMNSVSVDPMFISPDNLHTYSPGIDNLGTPLVSITEDIDGDTRDAVTPDIGADEFTPAPTDLGAYELIAPMGGDCFSTTETIIVSVYNYGLNPIDFSVTPGTVDVTTTGQNPVVFPTVNITSGVLPVGDTMQVLITTSYDMSAAGTYNFDAVATVSGDGNIPNDAMQQVVLDYEKITTFPHVETFETFGAGAPGTFENGWKIDPNTNYRWQVDNGGTPSANTGPDVDHTLGTSAGIYIYAEATSGTVGDTALLISPCMDISSLTVPTLKFWYHMYGLGIEQLSLELRENGIWNEIYSLYGQQQANQTDAWKVVTVSLAAYPNADKLRFRAIKGSDYGDIAIDDIQITEADANDIAVISWDSQLGNCGLTATESVTITIVNYGTVAQSNVPITYSIDDGTTWITNEIIAGPINPGDTVVYTFTATADFSAYQTYNCIGVVANTGDQYTYNDSLDFNITTAAPTAAPFTETFETFGTGTPGTFVNGWTMESQSAYRWQVDVGGTGSSDTGPDMDHTLGTSAGIYIYTEASNGVLGDETYLVSPCLDLSGLTMPRLSFWYHMYGATIDKLAVDIFDGASWVEVLAINGQQHISETDPYKQKIIDLSLYPGVEKIRFRGVRGSSYTGDIAIDDINIEEAPDFDFTVMSWIDPSGSCELTTTEDITIEVRNVGALAQDTIPVSYSLDGGNTIIGPEYIYPSIAPGASYIYTFTQQADMSAYALYNCVAFIDTVDSYSLNDSLFNDITNNPIVTSYPYYQNFEGANDWNPRGTNSSWELGTPAGNKIIGAASGVNAWMTGLNSNYNSNEISWVIGPCFDFSSLVTPVFEMDMWTNIEADWDGAVLQYSTDGGTSWTNVGAYMDPFNWYNDNSVDAIYGYSGNYDGWSDTTQTEWLGVKHELTGLGGVSEVMLRILIVTDVNTEYDGFAFDNILIYEKPDYDLAVTDWLTPTDGCILSSTETVTITVANYGLNPQTNIPVTYSTDNGATWVPAETITATINPGASYDYTFTATADFSTVGTHNCLAATIDPVDEIPYNDTLATNINIYGIQVFPYTEDFETAATGTPGVLPNLWSTSSNSTYLWYVNNGATSTTMTGPDNDHTTGVIGGKYVHTEASNGVAGDTADLYLPCMDISSYTNPILTFWYHMYGQHIDTLYIEVFDGGVWTTVYNIGGEQDTSYSDDWQMASVDLTAYTAATEIRFRAIKGNGDEGDIAIDDIEIYQPYDDVAVTEISSPISSCILYSMMHISVKVENFGTITYAPGDTILMGLEFNGAPQVVDTFVLTTALPPGSYQFYMFNGTFDMSTPGDYDIVSYTLMSADVDQFNDTTAATVSHYGSPAFTLGPDIITTQPDTVVIDAGAVWASYEWQDLSTTQTFAVDTFGTFWVEVTDTNGCTAVDTIVVANATGIENFGLVNYEIYPNPCKGLFTVEMNLDAKSDITLKLIDVNGETIFVDKVEAVSQYMKEYDIRELAKGIYYLQIITDDFVKVEKLIFPNK